MSQDWIDFESGHKKIYYISFLAGLAPSSENINDVTDWYCKNWNPYKDPPYFDNCPGEAIDFSGFYYNREAYFTYSYNWGVETNSNTDDYSGKNTFRVQVIKKCPESHPREVDVNSDLIPDVCIDDSTYKNCPGKNLDPLGPSISRGRWWLCEDDDKDDDKDDGVCNNKRAGTNPINTAIGNKTQSFFDYTQTRTDCKYSIVNTIHS